MSQKKGIKGLKTPAQTHAKKKIFDKDMISYLFMYINSINHPHITTESQPRLLAVKIGSSLCGNMVILTLDPNFLEIPSYRAGRQRSCLLHKMVHTMVHLELPYIVLLPKMQ